MTTMIVLISEQRMQNILPTFQKGAAYERIWLVRSVQADSPGRFRDAWKDTERFFGERCKTAERAVGADNTIDTETVVSEILEQEKGSAVVNFTGGTKLIALGAYRAVQEHKVNSLYVDTAGEKFIWVYPNGEVSYEAFDLEKRVNVEVYLRAHGLEINREKTAKEDLAESAYQAAGLLRQEWPGCISVLDRIGKAVSAGQPIPPMRRSATIEILEEHGLICRDNGGWRYTSSNANFLTGKWLEALTAGLLKDSSYFDDVQVGLWLVGINDELDIVLTRNGKCAIIECKSGKYDRNTVNKLEAISRKFGTFSRPYFLTSLPKVSAEFKLRTEILRVTKIFTRDDILKIAEEVNRRLGATQ